jgi:anti-anti-sigma regulatory factor
MDTTKDIIADIKTNEVDDQSILVELSGEFDLGDLESLRTVVDGALSTGLPIWVDLSRVTFLDMRVAQELAVQSQLHRDRLMLRNPSWQVEASVGACGFGGRSRSYPDRKNLCPANAQDQSERESHDDLALAV